MRILQVVVSIFILTLLNSCDHSELKKKTSNAETLFTLVPSEHTQINFENVVKQDTLFNCVRYMYALNGGGVAVGDINNDGLQDIYFTSNQQSNKLYLNKGNFEFEDITQSANVSDEYGWTTGTSMIDINNDGWLDIYVCKSASLESNEWRKNKLFINQKDGTFKEEAHAFGLDNDGFSIQSYFFDYDKDGDLDMYLVNHRVDFQNTLRIEQKESQKKYPETSDHLFRNDGNTFTDVTVEAKLVNKAWGLSASIGDYNNDGWPDIYVANDYIMPDFLYINNHDGTFSNQINTRFKHISFNSMGTDYADINNDFLPDLIVLEMSAEDHIRSKENMPSMNTEGFEKIIKANYNHPYMANVFQLNNGNGTYSDIGQLAGVSKTDWSWAPLIADFDNDGYKDLFITNGIDRNFSNQDYARKVKSNLDNKIHMTVLDVVDMMPSEKLSNYGYKNNGDLTFTNTTESWGLDKKVNSNGVAYADLDNDGDLDLIVNNISEKASVYKNNSTGNFVNIKLIGGPNNINAIGAKVKVFTEKLQQYQEQYPTRGYQSCMTNVLNFGLGNEDKIKKIEVVWDNRLVSIVENEQANQTLELNIKDAVLTKPFVAKANRNFTKVDPLQLGIAFTHHENSFNDFSKQVLLPQKLSQQGPALSVGDVNKDGLDDFYVGGAQGQSGKLYLQNRSGKFDVSEQTDFEKDKSYEDNRSLFFDANNDGYLDLYVTSGGYELVENSPLLQDRLYLNNGKGKFIKSTSLPKMLSCTKAVKAVDFDNDGDLDLAIGGHCIPGKYPLVPNSYFLRNDKGIFKDVTATVAPEFSKIGIVNDFIFSDYDNDGNKDLIVVGEWMPITVLKNTKSQFKIIDTPQFKNTEGWWNTVSEVDIDNDGDLDYFFGNIGGNNKFHPSVEKPLHIYGNNFDNNSTYDMVLSKLYKGNLVPVRGKECSTQQNSFVSKKMPTFKSFATSKLADIYGDKELKASYHKQAFQFKSGYAINNGKGSFTFKELPNTAQLGPTMSFVFADVNKDGFQDVIGVGGLYESEVETIRYDSNVGYILLGDTKGNLKSYKDLNFYNSENAKQMKKIQIKGKQHLLIANNDAPMSIFSLVK
ncbi:VCBS repeat-containing protein [Flavobacterium cellulosilyticum]|uniref:RNA-binding protein n=1 Tax=Flavobacterium cellulosilyticum TaxID=2541731 RepID=A0A4R5CGX5_9FLAO|nr:VCBS repeat-containing protein [Flavobacterium cellulosilyticum]TDD99371.1 RNA-binding protein [Flavobacterium cellulosilyticum]